MLHWHIAALCFLVFMCLLTIDIPQVFLSAQVSRLIKCPEYKEFLYSSFHLLPGVWTASSFEAKPVEFGGLFFKIIFLLFQTEGGRARERERQREREKSTTKDIVTIVALISYTPEVSMYEWSVNVTTVTAGFVFIYNSVAVIQSPPVTSRLNNTCNSKWACLFIMQWCKIVKDWSHCGNFPVANKIDFVTKWKGMQ